MLTARPQVMSDEFMRSRRFVDRLTSHPARITAAILVCLAVAIAFLWPSGAVVMSGVSHADDAYIALAAKSLAYGPGYGVPLTSTRFVPFDPLITTGPTLVVPTALAIGLLGALDRLPGAVTLLVFIAQLLLATALIARIFSFGRAIAWLATFLALLVALTARQWLFGALLGEPVALGFIVLAVICIASCRGSRWLALAGVFGGLAVLTKLIAGVAVAGLAVGLFIMVWRKDELRTGIRSALVFVLGATIPIACVETVRVVALGARGYVDYWVNTVHWSGATGSAPTLLARPEAAIHVLNDQYMGLGAVLCLATSAVVLALMERRRLSNQTIMMIGVLSISASLFALYFVFLSSIYPRYLWMGIGLAALLLAIPALVDSFRLSFLQLGTLVVVAIFVGVPTTIGNIANYATAAEYHDERIDTAQLLSGLPDVPYVAANWQSLYDIVFVQRAPTAWAYGRWIAAYREDPIIAIINRKFTDATSDFARSAIGSCDPMTPAHTHLLAYMCGDAFWQMYLPRSALLPSPWLEAPVVNGGRCGIEQLVDRQSPIGIVQPADRRNIWLYGWALDRSAGRAPDRIFVEIAAPGQAPRDAATTIEQRPPLASALGSAAFIPSGFRASIDAQGVPAGDYTVSLVADTGGALVRCPTRVLLRL
jgi:hypothetical protein